MDFNCEMELCLPRASRSQASPHFSPSLFSEHFWVTIIEVTNVGTQGKSSHQRFRSASPGLASACSLGLSPVQTAHSPCHTVPHPADNCPWESQSLLQSTLELKNKKSC